MQQSAIYYFADMVVCPLLAAALSIVALARFTRPAAVEWSLMVMIGAALWTLVEYVIIASSITAFLSSRDTTRPTTRSARLRWGAADGWDRRRFPHLICAIGGHLSHSRKRHLGGHARGYIVYMIVHHACHCWTPTPGGYLYRVRLHHAVHHYRDDNGNFGVTTSFWDRVLGTRIHPSTGHSPAIISVRAPQPPQRTDALPTLSVFWIKSDFP